MNCGSIISPHFEQRHFGAAGCDGGCSHSCTMARARSRSQSSAIQISHLRIPSSPIQLASVMGTFHPLRQILASIPCWDQHVLQDLCERFVLRDVDEDGGHRTRVYTVSRSANCSP